MKSCLFLIIMVASALAFAPPATQKRPISSRRFLCPEDAKDLEAIAVIAYEYQHLIKEATNNNNTKNTYNGHHRSHGPVAWCRRVLSNWSHRHNSSSTTTTTLGS